MLSQANFISLLFIKQKNDVKCKSIRHGQTGLTQGCPVAAMPHQVVYLRRHDAFSKKPLSFFKKATKCQQIRGDEITDSIRDVIQAASTAIGFTKADISVRSLHAGRAMNLLMVWVDPDTIRLVWRWRSNTMLRYPLYNSEEFHRMPLSEDVQTWRLLAHSTGSLWKLVPSGTQGPSGPLLPLTRGVWRPGIVSVWSWRHKYYLFSPLIV